MNPKAIYPYPDLAPNFTSSMGSKKRPRSESNNKCASLQRRVRQKISAAMNPSSVLKANSSPSFTSPQRELESQPLFPTEEQMKIAKAQPHYAREIYFSHRANEERFSSEQTNGGFLAIQTEITLNMRAMLVDWLNEVITAFGLTSQTLFLSIKYLDRFLEHVKVPCQTLQLVGITCLLIASKYEDISCPSVKELVNVTDNAYTSSEILRTELLILNTLKFKLTVATVQSFMTHLLHFVNASDKMVQLANYLAELTLVPYTFQRRYLPSLIATAIVFVVDYDTNKRVMALDFEAYSQYSLMQLKPCIKELYVLHRKAATNKSAATEKYLRSEKGISQLTQYLFLEDTQMLYSDN